MSHAFGRDECVARTHRQLGPFEQEYAFTGRIHAVETNRLLALEWRIPRTQESTYLSFHLNPSFFVYGQEFGDDTDIQLVHSGFPADGVAGYEYDAGITPTTR